MAKITHKDVALLTRMSAGSVQVEMSRKGLSMNKLKDILDFIMNKRLSKLDDKRKVYAFVDKYRRGKIDSFKEEKDCLRCGGGQDLQLHHVDYDHFNNSYENKRVLCASCHIGLHRRQKEIIQKHRREIRRDFNEHVLSS